MITLFDDTFMCCGCTACANICPTKAIDMKQGKEGFLYPVINHNLCIECGLCKKVCAFQNGYDYKQQLPSPSIYAVKHKDHEIRRSSSSGGAFTAFSDCVLKLNGSVYGAILDSKMKVKHVKATDQETRNAMRGSKYVQSDLENVFTKIKDDLLNKKNVIFSGTPCQCAGLKTFLHVLKCDDSNLITMDFICHGVPSPLIFKNYLNLSESKNGSKVVNYSFRSKIDGWNHTEAAFYENGKVDTKSRLVKSYKQLFYSNVCLRSSCHQCPYSNEQRVSDITIADFWGINKLNPDFFDELGVSAVMINSTKGDLFFNEIIKDFSVLKSDIENLKLFQNNLKSPSTPSRSRKQFWEDYNRLSFEEVLKKYTIYGNKRYLLIQTIKILKKLKLFDIIQRLRGGI